jgi:hypothetical protein
VDLLDVEYKDGYGRLDPVQRDRIKRRIRKEGLPEHAPHRAFAL